MTDEEIGRLIIDCSIRIHKEFGPGMLETVYEALLEHELKSKGLKVERQRRIPFRYKGIEIDEAFRADLVIEGKVVVELKSVEKVTGAHKKQVLTYLKLMGLRLGYLLNFGEALMVDGITRMLNGYDTQPL